MSTIGKKSWECSGTKASWKEKVFLEILGNCGIIARDRIAWNLDVYGKK